MAILVRGLWTRLRGEHPNGWRHARQADFFQQPAVRMIEWLRLPGDAIFILAGILPGVYLAVRMFHNRRRYQQLPADADVEDFTQVFETLDRQAAAGRVIPENMVSASENSG